MLSQFFLLFRLHQEALQFLFTCCHKGGIICISEVIDIFLAVLIPACDLSSPAFCISAYKLNKQGDYIQPWHTPFPIWNQSLVSCPILTVASWPAYSFLRRQETWSGNPVFLRIFRSLLWSTQSKALAQSVKQKQMFFWTFSAVAAQIHIPPTVRRVRFPPHPL